MGPLRSGLVPKKQCFYYKTLGFRSMITDFVLLMWCDVRQQKTGWYFNLCRGRREKKGEKKDFSRSFRGQNRKSNCKASPTGSDYLRWTRALTRQRRTKSGGGPLLFVALPLDHLLRIVIAIARPILEKKRRVVHQTRRKRLGKNKQNAHHLRSALLKLP